MLKPHAGHVARRSPLSRIGSWAANRFNSGFDRMSDGYARTTAVVARRKVVMLGIYAALAGATFWIGTSIPTGFIPQLDRGYAIVVVQLPDGASLSRTDAVVQTATEIIRQTPGVEHAIGITGLNGSTFTSTSNSGVVFATFSSFEERLKAGPSQSLMGIVGQLFGRLQSIPEAFIIAVPPPAVPGIGNSGGFKMQLQNVTGDEVRPLIAAAYQIMGRAAQTPGVVGVFTTFSANSPQVFLEIDRTKAQMLNVPIGNVFEALQVNLGQAYVNDFNAFGRVYQVRAQADVRFRLEEADIASIKVRSATGALVPLGTLVSLRDTAGPELIQRYNQYVSVPLQGAAAPGVSSGQALATMEQLARDTLLPGQSFEWTELALQQKLAGNTAIYIFALAVLFVFLALAAQYESWILPLAIILIVPLSALAAFVGVMLRGMDNNILVQVGLVVLVGLAAKNAILIVEFARQLEDQGRSVLDAVVEACRLRLRPILMTAFAFILGVVPLVIATGPGAEMRQALGTAVFAGMLGVTILGLFLTPVFYTALRGAMGTKKAEAAPPAEGQARAAE
jgi:HAE1 family hydrophobic/amphiphilic exporter-1